MESEGGLLKIQLNVSNDGLEAHIVLTGEPSEKITEEQILEELKAAGITYGILLNSIKQLVEKPVFNTPILVAAGKEPVDGKDGQVILTTELHKEEGPEKKAGKIDLRELPRRTRCIVKAGQEIAEIIPPTEGEEGKNVFGVILKPKPGKAAPVKLGQNVKLSEDGRKVLATKDGMLVARPEGLIEVSEVLVIKDNVDYGTGNIEFPGEVHIKGDVKPDFVVKAKRDIVVEGVIEAATVVSFEGSVNAGGIKGREKGYVKAKSGVKSRFLENVTVETDGDIEVAGPVTNSTLSTKTNVVVTSDRGVIAGGNIMAGLTVQAEEIGSPLGVRTRIEIGIDPEVRQRTKVLRGKLALDRENLEKLAKIYRTFKQVMEQTGGNLPKDKLEAYRKVVQSLINLRSSVEECERELEQLRAKMKEKVGGAKVVARRMLHAGVEIVILDKRHYVEKPLKKAVVTIKNGEIVIGGYSDS